jgi:hypothetical protein
MSPVLADFLSERVKLEALCASQGFFSVLMRPGSQEKQTPFCTGIIVLMTRVGKLGESVRGDEY